MNSKIHNLLLLPIFLLFLQSICVVSHFHALDVVACSFSCSNWVCFWFVYRTDTKTENDLVTQIYFILLRFILEKFSVLSTYFHYHWIHFFLLYQSLKIIWFRFNINKKFQTKLITEIAISTLVQITSHRPTKSSRGKQVFFLLHIIDK